MTQKDRVLKYMQDFGKITPLDAIREFGCLRLSARIFDLKRDGHNIISETETSKNRYGDSVSYASYRLEEK